MNQERLSKLSETSCVFLWAKLWAFPIAQLVKNLPAMRETWVWPLSWEDSLGEGKGYLLQYSGLEKSMDCIVHGIAKSWTGLSDFHFHGPHAPTLGLMLGLWCKAYIMPYPWRAWLLSHVSVALQAPLPMGFPRPEYWSGLAFPSPGIFPT